MSACHRQQLAHQAAAEREHAGENEPVIAENAVELDHVESNQIVSSLKKS